MSRSIILRVQSLILGVLLALVPVYFQGGKQISSAEEIRLAALADFAGKPAAPFHVITLTGKKVTLEDYRGKVFLLCFFHPA